MGGFRQAKGLWEEGTCIDMASWNGEDEPRFGGLTATRSGWNTAGGRGRIASLLSCSTLRCAGRRARNLLRDAMGVPPPPPCARARALLTGSMYVAHLCCGV